VIFEAGLAASSLSWARVQPPVASFANSVSYDRAGLGWSSPRTSPPSLGQMLDDVRSIIVWAGGGEPIVLVAHSFGALLLLAFTRHYPELVAGLVLVGPISLATWSDCSAVNQPVQHPHRPSVMRLRAHEVIAPDMVPPFWARPYQRSVVEPQPSFWLLFLWNLQPFTTPNTFHAVLAITRRHA
jgi:pimeloyl-ACP methyl ester carboxylesterase